MIIVDTKMSYLNNICYDDPSSNHNLFYPWVPFYWRGLILIPSWKSKYIYHKVCDEITYPFSKFKGATVEVWEWISSFLPHFTGHMITYPCRD